MLISSVQLFSHARLFVTPWTAACQASLPFTSSGKLLTLMSIESVMPSKSGFPCGSVGKESACDAGDPGSIPGSGRSSGEGIGYPLQYSWASLVTQLVKNPPAMLETWVRSLVWEEPL